MTNPVSTSNVPPEPTPTSGPTTPPDPTQTNVPPDPQSATASTPPAPSQDPAPVSPVSAEEFPDTIPENFKQFFKEHNFTPQQATEAINFAASVNYTEMQKLKEAGQQFLETWGEQKEANLKLAKQALKHYDSSGDLLKVLNTTGYGNHPAILNFFYTLGKTLKEGGFIKSEPHVPTKPRTLAQAMYGNTHPSKHN